MTSPLALGVIGALAAIAAFETALIVMQSDANKTRHAEAASIASRSYTAQCPAFDVRITGHDAESTDDARRAALALISECHDVRKGIL